MARTAVQLIVEGRVQGVGFRAWTVGRARRLGLAGWVRNRRDGAVEVLALGPADAIEALAAACAEGPRSAWVSAVRRAPGEDDGSPDFRERASI